MCVGGREGGGGEGGRRGGNGSEQKYNVQEENHPFPHPSAPPFHSFLSLPSPPSHPPHSPLILLSSPSQCHISSASQPSHFPLLPPPPQPLCTHEYAHSSQQFPYASGPSDDCMCTDVGVVCVCVHVFKPAYSYIV